MRTLLIFSFVVVTTLTVRSQTYFGIELKTGYSTYAMKELKHSMRYYSTHAGYPVKLTDNYPSFVHFGGTLSVGFDAWEFGLDYTYSSTGGRIHHRDYSGEYGFDQLAKVHAVGGVARYAIVKRERWQLNGAMQLAVFGSIVKLHQYARVGNSNDEDKIRTTSTSIGFTPSLGPVFKLGKRMYYGARIGYTLDTKGNLHIAGNNNAKLVDGQQNQLMTNWSGMRLDVFTGIRFY